MTSTSSDNSQPPPWWRRRSVQVWAAVLTVALVAAGVVIHHQRVKDRLTAGASRSGDYSLSGGYLHTSVSFAVPNARVQVTAEFGQRGARYSEGHSTEHLRAPRGGVLAHLTSTSTPSAEGHTGSRATRLSVRSGDTAVVVDRSLHPKASVDSATDQAGEKVVALPGTASDVVIEAEFAGRAQTVRVVGGRRVLGDFAGLYRETVFTSGPTAVSIARSQPADPKSPFHWSGAASGGQAYRRAYVEELGWAPPGREWVLVRGAGYLLDTTDSVSWSSSNVPDSMSDDNRHARYTPTGKPSVFVTVNSAPPAKVLGAPRIRTSDRLETGAGDYVFSVPAGDAFTVETTVRVTAHRTNGDTRAPATTTMQLRDSDTYPAAIDPTSAVRR